MSKVKFTLNRRGVAELMKSDEVQTVLNQYAARIRDRCGNGYEQDVHVGESRANAMVWAQDPIAKRENKRNNTILKAVR